MVSATTDECPGWCESIEKGVNISLWIKNVFLEEAEFKLNLEEWDELDPWRSKQELGYGCGSSKDTEVWQLNSR